MTTDGRIDFASTYDSMKKAGMKVPEERVTVRIPESRTILENCFRYFLSRFQKAEFKWIPEYENVAAWLENSEGRGLLLTGNCGLGKSMLARYVVPAILMKYCKLIVRAYDVQEMNANLDLVLSGHILSIDEVGMEDVSVSYGNRRSAFAEVMDAVEKYGKLIIISTNLSRDELSRRYGERVYERLVATTRRIEFKGKSMRK